MGYIGSWGLSPGQIFNEGLLTLVDWLILQSITRTCQKLPTSFYRFSIIIDIYCFPVPWCFCHANSVALWMAMSGGLSPDWIAMKCCADILQDPEDLAPPASDFEWNVPTATGWNVMKVGADIHIPLRTNCINVWNNFSSSTNDEQSQGIHIAWCHKFVPSSFTNFTVYIKPSGLGP